jgi:hypothetical protein
MDERPVRCWIHPRLKDELSEWQKVINKIAIEKTSYPVQRLENLPLTSNMCAMILKKVRVSLDSGDFNIYKDEKTNNLRIEVLFGNKEGDNNNLNIELQKIKGIKKNEIKFW